MGPEYLYLEEVLLEINSLRKFQLKGVTTRRVCGLEICSSVLWTVRPVLESLWAFVLRDLGRARFSGFSRLSRRGFPRGALSEGDAVR